MAGMMRERFAEVAGQLLADHERLAIVTADLSSAMFDKAREIYPERIFNLGIREQLLISVAGGLSLAGMRPIAHSFAPFLIERPFEQIKLDLNHQGAGAVLVSAGASYDISGGGRSHQAPADVALLNTLPDWNIHVPGHPDEVEECLRAAVAGNGLEYIRLSKLGNERPYGLGRAAHKRGFRLLREGARATVIVVGPLADAALAATEGLDVTLLYTSTARPFDEAGLRAAVDGQRETVVILVEPYLEGTSVPVVTRILADRPHRVCGLGVGHQEMRHYGTAGQHAIALGLDSTGLRRSISSFLNR